jgi:hypothetical protein
VKHQSDADSCIGSQAGVKSASHDVRRGEDPFVRLVSQRSWYHDAYSLKLPSARRVGAPAGEARCAKTDLITAATPCTGGETRRQPRRSLMITGARFIGRWIFAELTNHLQKEQS